MSADLRSRLTELLPRLRRFGLMLSGSMTDADDLVQGACERALRHGGQLRDEGRLVAWMYGIMRNLWIDQQRGARRRRHEPLEAAAEVAGEDGRATTEGWIDLAIVRAALAKLPAEQRTVLVLVCVDGLSYAQTSEVLQIPVGTVMSRLSRGRLALRHLLRPAEQERVVTRFPVTPTRTAGDQGETR